VDHYEMCFQSGESVDKGRRNLMWLSTQAEVERPSN